MDVLYFLGVCFAILAPIALFFMNNRLGERVDRLENENRVQQSNLVQLQQLYSALLAARHAPASAAAPAAVPAAAAHAAPAAAAASAAPAATVTSAPVMEEALAPPPPAPEPPPAPSPIEPAATWTVVPEPPAPVPPPPPPPPPVVEPETEKQPVLASAKRTFSWERFVGVSLPIWLGAIALSLAGFFFVRYIIEAGLFTPLFRVLVGVVAGIVFLGAAEAVRRSRISNAPQIAAALAAASIATLYASSYFASVAFQLIPELAGFFAMAVITGIAIAISLIYGRVVAVVGLIGGYVTPALYASTDPSALVLFGYLGAILVGTFALIRLKNWWGIAPFALIGPLVWMMIWSSIPEVADQAIWVAVFALLVPVVVMVVANDVWLPADGPLPINDAQGRPATPGAALLASFAVPSLGFLILLAQSGFLTTFWYGLIVLGALTAALGYFRPRALGLVQLAPLAAAVLSILAWPDPAGAGLIAALLLVVFAAGAAAQLWLLQRPVLWSSVLSAVALFFFLFGLYRVVGWEAASSQRHLWALAALVLAAAELGLLWLVGPRIAEDTKRNRTIAVLAGAASAFIALIVVIELDPIYFPLAAALQVLGLSIIHSRVRLVGLQIVAAVHAVIYGVLILGAGGNTGLLEPGSFMQLVLVSSIETAPLQLLVLPGLAFLAAATLFHRSAAETLAACLDVLGVVLLAWGIFHFAVPDLTGVQLTGFYVEAAKVLNPELVLAAAAVLAGRLLGRRPLYLAGIVLAAVVGAGMILVVMLPVYFFWPRIDLPGTTIFNVAVLTLGTPALILVGIGWFVRTRDRVLAVANVGRTISVGAVFALFTLMLVLIRHAYHPEQLQGVTGEGEFYTYSIAMLLFGVALLILGVALQNRGARMLSFIFVLAATVKVFLWDAAGLEGLWRVLSFFGMGLSFLAISWLYARFVFGLGFGRKPEAAQSEAIPATQTPRV